MVGPCPCGIFSCHGGYQCCTWPSAPPQYTSYDDAGDYYSSPSVDCTLSLGTPSTRRSSTADTQQSRRSNFCGWDFLQTNKQHSSSSSSSSKKSSSHRSANSNSNGISSNADPLIARRCTNCDTASTPLWRNGPRGPKSLCNACGIRYKKEERRASAAAATNAAYLAGGETMETHVAPGYYNGGWSQYQPEKMQYFLHVHDYTH